MGLFRKAKKTGADKMSSPEMVAMREQMHALMVQGKDLAEAHGLGYTRSEMAQVEDIIAAALEQSLTDDAKRVLHRQVTGYLYATIIRDFPDRWFVSSAPGNPVIMVVGEPRNNVKVLGWQKVEGRISNGAEDNLQFFYEGIVDYSERPGVHTLM